VRPSAYLSDTSRHTVMLVKKNVIVASTPQSSAPAAGPAGRYLHFHERVTAISGKRAGWIGRKEHATPFSCRVSTRNTAGLLQLAIFQTEGQLHSMCSRSFKTQRKALVGLRGFEPRTKGLWVPRNDCHFRSATPGS